MRAARLECLCAAVLAAACSGHKPPAQHGTGDIDAVVHEAAAAVAERQHEQQVLDEQWTSLSQTVPDHMAVIDQRLRRLTQTTAKPTAHGDVAAARTGLAEAGALWSKAQAAFAAGNLQEAVATARRVSATLGEVESGLGEQP